jgi:hypothetical protein
MSTPVLLRWLLVGLSMYLLAALQGVQGKSLEGICYPLLHSSN